MLETWLQALPLFRPTDRVPLSACSQARSTLPQEQSSVALLQYRCLSLMSITFKRKNKNWTKDQWNWYDIHELRDIYLIGVVGKWMDIICLITIINHPTEMWNSKVQFKIDPYAQLKNWTFQVKNLIPSTKYMKKLNHLSPKYLIWVKSHELRSSGPHGNFDCGTTWHFKCRPPHVPNLMHKLL